MKSHNNFYSSLYELNPTNPTQIIVQISTDNNANSSQIECVALILNSQLQLDDASQDVIHRQNPKSKNQAILQNKAGNAVFIDCDQLDESQTVHIVALFEPSFKGNLKAIFRAKNGAILKELIIDGLITLSKSFKGYALHHQKQWQIHSIGEFSTQNLSQLVESYQYVDELPADDFDFDSEFGESQKDDNYFANEFETIIIEAEFEEIKRSNGIQKRQSTALINKPTTALKTVSTALVPTQTNNYKGIAPRKNLSLELPKMLYAREVYTTNHLITPENFPTFNFEKNNNKTKTKVINLIENRYVFMMFMEHTRKYSGGFWDDIIKHVPKFFDLSLGRFLTDDEVKTKDNFEVLAMKEELEANKMQKDAYHNEYYNQQNNHNVEGFTSDKRYKICGSYIFDVKTELRTHLPFMQGYQFNNFIFTDDTQYLVALSGVFQITLWELEER